MDVGVTVGASVAVGSGVGGVVGLGTGVEVGGTGVGSVVAVGSGVLVGSGVGAAAGTDCASGAVGSGAVSDSPPQAMTASVNRASNPKIDLLMNRLIESRLYRYGTIKLYRRTG